MFNKKRIQILLFSMVLVFVLVLVAGTVFAKVPGQESLNTSGEVAGYQGHSSDIYTYATGALNVVLGVVGFIFFGFILYAGVRWMTAHGQDELKQKAKDTLTNATIGLVIVVGAYAITSFIFKTVDVPAYPSGDPSGDPVIPQILVPGACYCEAAEKYMCYFSQSLEQCQSECSAFGQKYYMFSPGAECTT